MSKAATKNGFKLPRTDAERADLLYNTRQQRLALQKEVDALQEQETELSNYFIENLPKSRASGVAGQTARVQLNTKTIPTVEDWSKFYKHVQKTGAFELLQRRLTEKAVTERWDAGERIPGVGRFNVVKVSCTLLK